MSREDFTSSHSPGCTLACPTRGPWSSGICHQPSASLPESLQRGQARPRTPAGSPLPLSSQTPLQSHLLPGLPLFSQALPEEGPEGRAVKDQHGSWHGQPTSLGSPNDAAVASGCLLVVHPVPQACAQPTSDASRWPILFGTLAHSHPSLPHFSF